MLAASASGFPLQWHSVLPGRENGSRPKFGAQGLEQQRLRRESGYLANALVHLTCMTGDEERELIGLTQRGSCTRRRYLSDDVTHIVVCISPCLHAPARKHVALQRWLYPLHWQLYQETCSCKTLQFLC